MFMQHHNDTIIKTDAGRLLYKYMHLSLYCKGSKRLLKVCVWEGAGDRTETVIFWPPPLVAVNVVSFSSSRCSTGGPGVHSVGCWLFLLHLISNFSDPQTPSGFPRAPSVGCGFPYHISSSSVSNSTGTATWLLSWLSYIIVQRPLDRPLDLWNRMFNRHQAEITVMQFRGHSLPVRLSMRVSWDFFSLSHFVGQFPPTRFPLLAAIRMCHFLPVHHLEWHFGPGRRSKYNNNSTLVIGKQSFSQHFPLR